MPFFLLFLHSQSYQIWYNHTQSGMVALSMYEALFGNRVVELCLLYITNYGEGHINGIAKTFGVSPGQVQRMLEKLEADGILVHQFSGNTKNFRINPRLAIKHELTAILEKMLTLMPEDETETYFRQRRRPRRTGKAL
jgi:predicted ArsR family transcriptional regulator